MTVMYMPSVQYYINVYILRLTGYLPPLAVLARCVTDTTHMCTYTLHSALSKLARKHRTV